MSQADPVELLERLSSSGREEAWKEFILRILGLFETDQDRIADAFLYVCETLRRDGCRRLVGFRTDGRASFDTWLRAVGRRRLRVAWVVAQPSDPRRNPEETEAPTPLCPGTPPGELVDPGNGCSIAQLCPCDGPRGTNQPWKNHCKHVSWVAHAAEDFLEAGLITEAEKDQTVSDAAQSSSGDKR